MPRIRLTLITILTLLVLAGAAVPAAAEPEPSSDLLLPWFEVHLSSQRTTLFAVGNAAEEALEVKVSVHTNWGIPVVERTLRLQAGEVKTANLRGWLVAGNVPDPVLRGVDLEHVQAALAGQLSPQDDLYYATQADPFDPELMVGYVTFRVTSSPRLDALWGDYFWADPEQDYAEGELLVDIDRSSSCGALCRTHRMRFMDGGGFEGGTKLVVWSPRRVQPAPDANAAFARQLALSPFHREPGEEFDERVLELLPVQLVDVRELFLEEDFGWMDVKTEEEIYVGVRYSASNRYSVALQTWCIPPPPPEEPKRAGIDIEKFTNGEDADTPTGPEVPPGGDVTWEYRVTNTGNVLLSDIRVTDDQEGEIDCPKTSLGAGESMTCTHSGIAPPAGEEDFQYANLATVTATPPTGADVTDDDPSHYWVEGQPPLGSEPAIDLEKHTNGQDADAAPGPTLSQGAAVTWTYIVRNTGSEGLEQVQVIDDREGAVSCPKTTLAIGEEMTCTLSGVAAVGQYRNESTVTAESAVDGQEVSDGDPSHYFVPSPPSPAAIDIEKATNGFDADSAPGPELQVGQTVTWTYVVTNTGQAVLTGVAVSDDREGAVSCPKSTLQPGESMTCTETGTAEEGQYANLGSVTGASQEDGSTVSDSDPSHYFGQPLNIEGQGCTPGYWKTHPGSWPPTGYSTGQAVQSVFSTASAYPAYGSASLLQALSFTGGPGVEGGVQILLRAAVAGLLNTAHDGVTYPRTTAMLISDVDVALASGDRDTMLLLATQIDNDNNLGCPLN